MSEPDVSAALSVSYTEDGKPYVDDLARAEAVCFSEPWSASAIEEFLSQPYNHVLAALVNGVFAGYITYTRIADEIQIANVAVLPEFRRKGLADGLLCRLAQSAKRNGVTKTGLEVRVSNLPARNLYEKNGFEAVGSRRNFYKNPTEDAVLYDRRSENNAE